MTKTELTVLIMEKDTSLKKTNLMKMHISDLEALASTYEETEQASSDLYEPVPVADDVTLDVAKVVVPLKTDGTIYDVAATTFDKHKKLVKGPRIDKAEFKKTAIQEIINTMASSDSSNLDEVTIEVINRLLENKTYFCPINDIEKLMLQTIPAMSEFQDESSIIEGKRFLQKVGELHGVPASTSRALMVSLCRKGFYEIKGVKSGQKQTTLLLMPRGVEYLKDILAQRV